MVVSGCGKAGSVSLEEALTMMHTNGEIETDLSGIDDLSTIQEQVLCVYICGAVLRPGVYELEAGSRIVSAVEAAGGFLPDAATEAVNLAKRLEDGMQIVVPTTAEAEAQRKEVSRQEARLVNLNTASVAELCTLSAEISVLLNVLIF